jgi:hypothetical protein
MTCAGQLPGYAFRDDFRAPIKPILHRLAFGGHR